MANVLASILIPVFIVAFFMCLWRMAVGLKRNRVERQWVEAWRGDIRNAIRGSSYQLSHGYRTYVSPYGTDQRIVDHAQVTSLEQGPDEAVLLGPVSAWVAEGEAQAVRDWEAKHPTPQPPSDAKWVTLYHPGQGASHRVPNNPVVIAHFQTQGWTLPEPPADITGFKMTWIR